MTNLHRRSFIKTTTTAVALTPLALLLKSNGLLAADNPMVDESSAQAVALKYVAVSDVEGQNCSNCALYQGTPESEAGPCALFPSMNVSGPGWCSAWVAKS